MLETSGTQAAPPHSPGIEPLPPAQIEALYRSLRAPLRHFLHHRLRNPEAAEDVLHDVFVKIHQHAGEVRRGDRLESWIWTIARNAVVDRQRRTRSTEPLLESLENAGWEETETFRQHGPTGPSGGEFSAAEPETNPLHRTVRLFLECLPEPYREALVQADLEGASQKELAARLGISHSGLKSRVQRARRMMGDLLQQCCHLEFDRYGNIVDYSPRSGHCAGCHDAASIEESVTKAGGRNCASAPGVCAPRGDEAHSTAKRKSSPACADSDSCKC